MHLRWVVVDSRSILTLDDYKAYAGTAPIQSGDVAGELPGTFPEPSRGSSGIIPGTFLGKFPGTKPQLGLS